MSNSYNNLFCFFRCSQRCLLPPPCSEPGAENFHEHLCDGDDDEDGDDGDVVDDDEDNGGDVDGDEVDYGGGKNCHNDLHVWLHS